MESISNSFAPAPNHRTFGGGARASGTSEACGKKFRCHWIGRSMSLTKRRPLLQSGPASDCPPKPSFIEPRTGRCAAKKNEPIHGAMTSQIGGAETSAGTDGILFQ